MKLLVTPANWEHLQYSSITCEKLGVLHDVIISLAGPDDMPDYKQIIIISKILQ